MKTEQDTLKAGDFIEIEPDLALANDITAPIAINEFKKVGGKEIPYAERAYLVPDHFTPNKDILSAQQVKILRDFAKEYPKINFFEQGEVGVEHALLPEIGAILPGMVIIGADSHTCTYGALGAFATGVGSTDIAGFYLTGRAWLKVPPSIKVVFKGTLDKWVTGKDLILLLIGKISVSGAQYKALEFSGPVITDLSVEARLTKLTWPLKQVQKMVYLVLMKKYQSTCRDEHPHQVLFCRLTAMRIMNTLSKSMLQE